MTCSASGNLKTLVWRAAAHAPNIVLGGWFGYFLQQIKSSFCRLGGQRALIARGNNAVFLRQYPGAVSWREVQKCDNISIPFYCSAATTVRGALKQRYCFIVSFRALPIFFASSFFLDWKCPSSSPLLSVLSSLVLYVVSCLSCLLLCLALSIFVLLDYLALISTFSLSGIVSPLILLSL